MIAGRTISGALALLLSLAGAPGGAEAQSLADLMRTGVPAGAGLFGSVEMRSESLEGLPQWTRVVGSQETEVAALAGCADEAQAGCADPAGEAWRTIIGAAAGLERGEQIALVNDFFNRWPYQPDGALYGRSEYWATPAEFMTNSGDCEDYAIAKYFALRELGLTEDELRIVILMDRIRGVGHAVLAVYVEDDILILDNLSDLILPHARYKHYVPQYSMNESARWAHIGGFERGISAPYQGLAAWVAHEQRSAR